MKVGTIISFDKQRGFGFINYVYPDGNSRNIFFHITGLANKIIPPIGATVEFSLSRNAKGSVAIEIKRVDSPSSPAMEDLTALENLDKPAGSSSNAGVNDVR